MEYNQLLESAERYIRGEMSPEEQVVFEHQRKTNPEIDQLVVEHTIFLKQINEFGDRKNFKSLVRDVHTDLMQSGQIKEQAPKARVVSIMRRYSRDIAVAASIAGLTALAISGLVVYLTPKTNTAYVEQLSRKVHKLEQNQHALNNRINTNEIQPKIPMDVDVKSGGTSFLIDPKGYLVTNAHVLSDNTNVVLQNSKGHEFKAIIVKIDRLRDLAILKIQDADFKPLNNLPYGFKKSGADLGEAIFTLGFPRDEIVYGEGYMSAKTGYNGDTLACQIAVAANPGNSGGPVINRNGEVIGILSTRQVQAEGVVFAIKTKNIFRSIEELKTDTAFQKLKISSGSSVRGVDRIQQIKKIQDCVFMVKTY